MRLRSALSGTTFKSSFVSSCAAMQVALLLLWTMTSNCQSSATMTLPAADIYLAYQVLAASQFCAFCFFRILWRGTDPASSMAWSLQAYLFVGWSYWLLGAAVQLTTQCGMHLYGQQTLLMLHRANCASLEFIFAYSIQRLGCQTGSSLYPTCHLIYLSVIQI